MTNLSSSNRSRVRRLPKRAAYDRETIYSIIDEALICHVGFVVDEQPFVIPTLHARIEDTVYLHGSAASRLMRHGMAGHRLCLTITHVDGIVLARSIFNHSMNYRSAVVFGVGQSVEEPAQKLLALKAFSEQILPGRWADARPPNDVELKATEIIAVPIEEASAKIRTGPPGDELEDYALPIWAGVLPLRQAAGDLLPDERLLPGVEVPAYLSATIARYGSPEE